ncbi:IclR family transcriptional regulator [Alicyclobacillus fodiniaquatilis]|jgi:IclR family KDG regulon transcriptional repressor|uniref:IclR family transcriptional regulator n=1 Tax=Alicyclobacillus fodiniaquatilis TaxID=1661150 RepID=A0ABW4JCU3_9BACL
MKQAQTNAPYGTAILKGVDIIKYIADQPHAKGVSEIARDLGMNRSTVYKLLDTLQQVGFVHKSERNATYTLGAGLVRLAHQALNQLDIRTFAQNALAELNHATQETIHLGILDEDMVVYVAKLESKQTVRMHSRVGNTSPLYCTGIGKAILSTWSEERLDAYFARTKLHKYTAHTVTDEMALRQMLQQIAQQGYAMDDCEHEAEVRCMAAPLYKNNVLYGAFSVTAPVYRFDDDTAARYIPLVKACQKDILAKLP